MDVAGIVLTDAGYDVTTLIHSKDIFSLISYTDPPALILLDLWMPQLSGQEITQRLKADDRLKDIPVVILSASRKTEGIAKKIGADDFMCKPFDIEELEQVVRKYTS